MITPLRQILNSNPLLKSVAWSRFLHVVVGGGLVGVVLGIALLGFYLDGGEIGVIRWLMMILLAILPVLVAIFSATILHRARHNGDYQLLYLSPLPANQLLWGYIGLCLYRLRWLVTGQALILPILIVASYDWLYDIATQVERTNSYAQPMPPTIRELILPLLGASVFWAGLVAMNLVQVSMGIWAGLRWAYDWQVIGAASLGAAVIMAGLGAIVGLLVLIPQANQVIAVFCMPFGLAGWGAIMWANVRSRVEQQWREPTDW